MSINVKNFSLNSSGFSMTQNSNCCYYGNDQKIKTIWQFHIYDNYHSSANYFCTKNTLKHREISAIFKYITNNFFNKSFTINTTIWNSSFHDSLDLSRFFDWKNTLLKN